MIASITYDHTGSYDGFMVVMSLVLLASGLALFQGKSVEAIKVEGEAVPQTSVV